MTTLFKKRLEILSELGTVELSPAGNYYVVLSTNETTIEKIFTARCATKNTLHKLNTNFSYKKRFREIIMLTSDNKIKYKPFNRDFYSNLTNTVVQSKPELLKLYVYNKKCEFLRNYSVEYLKFYSFLRSFRSMSEVFTYLGITAKVEYSPDLLEKCIVGYNFKNKTLILQSDLAVLNDTIRLANDIGRDITQTEKSIKNLHDELIEVINMKDAEGYSDEKIVPPYFDKFEKVLKPLGATFYTSKKQLFLAGKAFNNCIAGRSHRLNTDVFFSMNIGGIDMIFESQENQLVEGKGRYNTCYEDKVSIIEEILKFKKTVILPF